MADDTTTTSSEGTGDPGLTGAPGGTAPTPTPEPPPATTQDDGRKFTQAELDKLAGRRAAEAERAAAKKLAEKLGMSVDDAVQLIADHKAAEDAKKDELTRAQEAAATAQRDAEAARAEAARLQRESLIERKLVAAGVGSGHPADKREAVLTRARAALVLAADADPEAIDAEIANTVELIPGLIAPQGPATTPAPSGVTSGATPPAGGQPAKTALERGRERARAATPASNTERPDPFAALRTA
jgi:hypothetical protein